MTRHLDPGGPIAAPPDAPPWLRVETAAGRPDLWDLVNDEGRFEDLWPEYNRHGNHAGRYFGALVPTHAHLQLLYVDDRTGQVIARGRTIPFRWDGTLADLPPGIDVAGVRAVTETLPPTALSALAAEVDPSYQASGLSALLLVSMRDVARRHGLGPLVAPVRPNRKDRYPLMPIDRYADWRRDDGLLFDPWMRTHERVGGRILRCEPRSLEITAPVADWEQWTDLEIPEDGTYVIPGGLAPLDVTDGIGTYFEPNVWMLHDV